jgi:threonine/homoserine/homoserine lactone efflux protein
MTFLSAASFGAIMLVLAALPSASVALVVVHAAKGGFRRGVAVTAGIVVADLVFVGLALAGLSALDAKIGHGFWILRLVAAAYLLWLGIHMLRKPVQPSITAEPRRTFELGTSFSAGFVLTMGDVKALLFYASLFPALVDLNRIKGTDALLICSLTILSVGGVKLVYAALAQRIAVRFAATRPAAILRRLAGALLILVAIHLVVAA